MIEIFLLFLENGRKEEKRMVIEYVTTRQGNMLGRPLAKPFDLYMCYHGMSTVTLSPRSSDRERETDKNR